ncbi:alpha-amylase [Nesidiocoris tenuis]|nr:alpha-amylase [Nesidiocoris tenuis]
MDWRFDDIARECDTFLSKSGYSAVLISPVHEPPEIPRMPWYERYQVYSYNITTRSGNVTEFQNMVQRCSKAGLKVYVEVVLNHMSTNLPLVTRGLGGSVAQPFNKLYPALSLKSEHFHSTCGVVDYLNSSNVRQCELDHRHDLFQKHEHVRTKQAEFLNKLIDLGVNGFKICNAKYMYPDDLEIIMARINKLKSGDKPFVFSEVPLEGRRKEAVRPEEYFNLGPVTEYRFESFMKSINLMERESNLSAIVNYTQDLMSSNKSVVFVDLMDVRNVWDIGLRKFRVFNTFMLAQPYGAYKTILSSYWMNRRDPAPPHYENKTIKHVEFKDGYWCKDSWNCEHRDPLVSRMIQFARIVEGTNMTNFTVHGSSDYTQISFCRPGKGFVAISDIGYSTTTIKAQTCLPPGRYCNLALGSYVNKAGKRACAFTEIKVAKDGTAMVTFSPQEDGIVALHIKEMANNGGSTIISTISAVMVYLTVHL